MNLRRIILLCLFFLILLVPACFAATLHSKLTETEKEFIKEHPVIRLGVDPKFIPYEFIDTDGVYKGITADYIKLITERTGLQFILEKDLTWEQAHNKAVLKQLDALPCVGITKERQPYFLFSNPYYRFQRVLFINEKNSYIKSFADIKNASVAVQVNSSHHGYLKNIAPNTVLSLYVTVEDALKAVSEEREQAFVGNLATSIYLAKANGITNLKYINMDEETQFLYFAVRNDWPILVGILNKALADISEAEKIQINNRWIGVQKKVDYSAIIKKVIMIGAVIVIIFAVSIFWIIRLKNEIKMRRQVEAELMLAKEEAEYANKIKSSFLARMSHEIRTPLNAINGMAYVMRKTNVTSMQKKYLDNISRSARDMLAIINDILDFSKIEAGKIDIETIPFNLDDVLQQIISILSFKIEEHSIDFSVERDPELPIFYWGDQNRIQQVLLNLVNNAVKFTEKGKVSLTVRLIEKIGDSNRIEFRVSDTGIGMSSDQLKQVFTPFSQADSSISRRFGGTGLGLSIVKNLVELMGGSIEAFSEIGKGSTFSVRLTLRVDRDLEREEKKTSVYFQNVRVLIIEKSSFYTNILKGYLDSFHISADFVSTESKALDLLKREFLEEEKPYNLIIIDFETLHDRVHEFCKTVNGLSWLNPMPKLILMLPITKEELLEKLEPAGIGSVITKPIIPSLLYNEIVDTLKINGLKMRHQEYAISKEAAIKVDYPYHVLIVEDNATNQFIAQSILTQAGFSVTLAENGREGYEAFITNPNEFDIILMDLHMPVMDGYEATGMIRDINSDIPIIAMTADAIAGVEEKCKDIGISHYISKPFDPDKLVELVYQAVKSHKTISKIVKENKGAAGENNSVLDVEDGIKHMGGKADIYQLVLKEYYKENQGTASLLNEAMDNKDYAQLQQIVHKIKSSSGSIGAKEFYDAVVTFQRALIEKDEENISKLYIKCASLLDKLMLEIEQRISD